MQEFLIALLDFLGFAWWVEVKTDFPRCTYYFGPFLSAQAADAEKPGYIEDLQGEGAQGISVEIKRFKPTKLTISEDLGETQTKVAPSFSSSVP